MEYELSIKILTLLVGVIGAGKLLYDISLGKHGRLRDEYKFAKKFMDELAADKELHPFLKEKGYQAIAGDANISADEVEYLLSLKGPERALKDYVLGQKYLVHLPEGGNLQLAFKEKYNKKWPRTWRRYFFARGIFCLGFSCLWPVVAD